MLQIDYQQTSFLRVEHEENMLEQIEHVIQYAYKKHPEFVKKNWEMSIIFTNNAEIQAINKQYRDKDQVTDVLSFAFNDASDPVVYGEGMVQILGEIFISIERVHEQALTYNHSFERELIFLALHGFLHLLGYDHMNEADEAEMFGLQKAILTELKIKR